MGRSNSTSTATDTSEAADTPVGDAQVEVSGDGVEVSPSVSDKFEEVTLYHRDGRELQVNSLEGKYRAEFNGFSTKKPESKKS